MIIDLIILLLAILLSITSSLILLQRIKLSPLLEVKLVSMAFMFQSVGYLLFLPTALLDGSASLNQLEVATVTYRLGLTLILIWGLILSVATSLPSLKEDLVSMYKVIILFATFSISGTYNALTVEVITDSGVVRFKFDALGVIILALSISLIVLLVANRSYYMYRRVSEEALLKYIILMVTFGLTTVLILTANLLSPLPPLPLFSAVFSGSVATFILALMMHYHEHLYFGSGTILYGIYLLNRNDFSVIHAKMIQNDFLNEKTFVKKLVSLQQSLTELVGGQEEVKEIHWRDKVILFEERGNILITFLVSQKNWIVLSLLHYIAMNVEKKLMSALRDSSVIMKQFHSLIDDIKTYFIM